MLNPRLEAVDVKDVLALQVTHTIGVGKGVETNGTHVIVRCRFLLRRVGMVTGLVDRRSIPVPPGA
jgi:hypothetical protein